MGLGCGWQVRVQLRAGRWLWVFGGTWQARCLPYFLDACHGSWMWVAGSRAIAGGALAVGDWRDLAGETPALLSKRLPYFQGACFVSNKCSRAGTLGGGLLRGHFRISLS